MYFFIVEKPALSNKYDDMDVKIDSQINIWQFGVSMFCFEFTMYQFLSTDSVIINTGIAFDFDLNI